jgi:hypothetical protein
MSKVRSTIQSIQEPEKMQIPERVAAVFVALAEWEELPENNYKEFSAMWESIDVTLMYFEMYKALLLNSPPDPTIDQTAWDLFVLNVFIEYGQEYGLNNIKSIIKNKDRDDIVATVDIIIGSGHQMPHLYQIRMINALVENE